jgi:predicted ribosomally synthesized peptide with nif11-like leader
MSIEQAQAFTGKVKNDEDLQKRMSETPNAEGSVRLKIAVAMGYDLSAEDIRQA